MAACFLLPSPLIFLSGLHKDLFIFTALCFFIYLLYRIIHDQPSARRYFLLLLSFAVLLLLRNYVALAILPGAIAYIMAEKKVCGKAAAFLLAYSISAIVISGVYFLKPGYGPLQIIVSKHEDFKALDSARSVLPMFDLKPEPASFLRNLPVAVNHAFFRPYPTETINIFHLAFSEELVLFWIMAIYAVAKERKNSMPPFTLFMLCFAITGLLFIGYIVPNAGSLIRYRAFYLPFLLPAVMVAMGRSYGKKTL